MVCNNNNNNNGFSEAFNDLMRDLIMMDMVMKEITKQHEQGIISTEKYNDIKSSRDETMELLQNRLNENRNR